VLPADRLLALQDIAAAMAAALTPAQVARVAVQQGATALEARTAGLYVTTPEGDLEVVALRGIEDIGLGVIQIVRPTDEYPVALALRMRAPLWVESAREYAERWPALAERVRVAETGHAVCAVPLVVEARLLGLIAYGYFKDRAFSPADKAFVLDLAQHCAQALERARLLEAARLSNDRLRFLARAGETLSGTIDYEATLDNVVNLAVPDIADFCVLEVIEPDRVRRLSHAWEDEATTAQLRTLSDAGDEALATLGPSSVVRVPLETHGTRIGTLTLCHGRSGRRHTADDVDLATELGRRAALAIENARLYRREKLAAQRAEDANRAKDEFLSIVSHELRTPLNAVVGWAHILSGAHGDSELVAKGLGVIRRNAEAQAKIIEDILDVSRIIAGKLHVSLKAVDLATIARGSIDTVRPAAAAKRIELSATLAAEVPIHGDTERLQQVVDNLLSNAIKFTVDGGHVDVALATGNGAARLSVRDTGRGIAKDDLARIFDRFRQGDSSTTRAQGGLGLGLAIARHIVEAHGGSITAESDGIGHGAMFTVTLPVAHPSFQPSSTPMPPRPAAADHAVGLGGVRVLVVDDDRDATELVALMLERRGADVLTAGSVDQALDVLVSAAPQVIVSDLGMPGQDGFTLIERVRQLAAPLGRVPAIALSAYARPEDAKRAVVAGYDMHLPKPADAAVLTAAIASLAK
jgi:signal transduction histidine kinase